MNEDLTPEADRDDGLLAHTWRLLPARVGPAITGLVSVPLLARWLHPAAFGEYSLVVSTVGYLLTVVGDWVLAGYQRTAYRDEAGPEAQAALWTLVVAGSGTAIFMGLGLGFHIPTLSLSSLVLLPMALLRLQWSKLQMTQRSTEYSAYQVAYSLIRAAALAVAAVAIGTAAAVVIAWAAVTAVVVALGPRLRLRARPRLGELRTFIRFGGPLAIMSVGMNVASTFDRYIVAGFESSAAVGMYSLGYGLAEGTVGLVASVVYLAIYPILARKWDEEGEAVARLYLRRVLVVQAGGLTLVAVMAATVVPLIIPLIAGSGYGGATDVYGLVALAQVALCSAQMSSLVGVVSGRTHALGIVYLGVAVANVGVTTLLVATMGARGAALATVLTYVVLLLLITRVFWNEHGFAEPVVTSIGLGFLAVAYLELYDSHAGLSAGNLAFVGLGLIVAGWDLRHLRARSVEAEQAR